MKLPFSNSQLVKIGAAGAVFVIGNGLLMKWMIQKRLLQSPYFEHARDVLMENRELVDILGEPVGFGTVNLDNPKNYSTTTEAKFEVPLKGSKTEGSLFLEAVRNNTDLMEQNVDSSSKSYSGWKLRSLEATLKDRPKQKVILVKQSVD